MQTSTKETSKMCGCRSCRVAKHSYGAQAEMLALKRGHRRAANQATRNAGADEAFVQIGSREGPIG